MEISPGLEPKRDSLLANARPPFATSPLYKRAPLRGPSIAFRVANGLMKKLRPLLLLLPLGVALLSGCGEKTPAEKLERAMELLQTQETARAQTTLLEITRKHPEDPAAIEASLVLARLYASMGNAAKALETLETVANKRGYEDQAGRIAHEGIVQINAQLQNFEAAINRVETVLSSDGLSTPTQLELNLQKANLMFSIQGEDSRTTEAVALLQSLIDSEDAGERGAARETLANYYRTIGDFDSSNAVYDAYLSQYPDDPIRIQLLFAKVLNTFNRGDRETALAEAAELEAQYLSEIEALSSGDEQFNQYRILGQNMIALQQLDKAELYFKKAMGAKPMSVEALRTQFSIADMFIQESFYQADKDLFARGIKVLEQIISENANSNIAFTAEEQITQANKAFAVRLQQVDAAKAAAEAQATTNAADAATSPTK